MPILYKQAKEILAPYVGRGGTCPTSEKIDLFCRKVFQYLLFKGSHGSLRKFCFQARKGCITVPYELEAPLKVKIDNSVGTVWNKWFEYYNYEELEGCVPVANALYEEGDDFPSVYDLPNSFCRVGCLGTADESADANLIVSGLDASGREIITDHQGEKISGELLRIRKGFLRYTQVKFSKITGIVKSKTVGYVQLYWVRPELSTKGFLSDYGPFEEVPAYRRFKVTYPNCTSNAKISVIGRIRLKEHYADNEKIPFDNLFALEVAGQNINVQGNNDPAMAAEKEKVVEGLLLEENEYKRIQPGSPVDVFYPLSGGAIKGIV